jgi:hypothetical protein
MTHNAERCSYAAVALNNNSILHLSDYSKDLNVEKKILMTKSWMSSLWIRIMGISHE